MQVIVSGVTSVRPTLAIGAKEIPSSDALDCKESILSNELHSNTTSFSFDYPCHRLTNCFLDELFSIFVASCKQA